MYKLFKAEAVFRATMFGGKDWKHVTTMAQNCKKRIEELQRGVDEVAVTESNNVCKDKEKRKHQENSAKAREALKAQKLRREGAKRAKVV